MPNNKDAMVGADKISDYLLNDTHGQGKHKAAFFKSFGFSANSPKIFTEALKIHAIERELANINDSPFGKKYHLECIIKTPDDRNPCVVTVWIIENGSDQPRLITAYPAKLEEI